MASSVRLGKVMGISIEFHITFVLFLFLIGFFAVLQNDYFTFFFLVSLFTCVLLHELSHSIVAIRNGINVSKIVLLPVGGIASIEEFDISPVVEFKMALAGPLFNFLLVFAVTVLAFFTNNVEALSSNEFLSSFIYANLMLGSFNLFLPALPLDGGRVLRSILAMRMGNLKATRILSVFSSITAMLLVTLGILMLGFSPQGIWLIVIGIFVFVGASVETETAVVRKVLTGVSVKDLMTKKVHVFDENMTIAEALSIMIGKRILYALVKSKWPLLLDLDSINSVDRAQWGRKKIRSVGRKIMPITLNAPADDALKRMIVEKAMFLPVLQDHTIVGVITRGDVERYLELVKVAQGLAD